MFVNIQNFTHKVQTVHQKPGQF